MTTPNEPTEEEARKTVQHALAEILHARRLGYDTCPWLNWIGPGPFGDVRVVESEEIHMYLHAMPFDLAQAVCQTIREYQNARGWPPGPRSNPGKAW